MWGLIVSISVLCLVVVVFKISFKRLPLPPGPEAKFWTGNVHQLPTTEPWLTYAKWSQNHGPVVFFRVHGRRMLILNTLKVALDLLESRASLYSDRPMAWMYKELVGRKLAVFNISVKHPRFKIYRKLLQSGLNQRATRTYRAIQEEETKILLRGLARSPEQFVSHIRRNAGAVILKVAYGWTVAENDDYFVSLMEESFKVHAEIVKPGRWLVDTYPIRWNSQSSPADDHANYVSYSSVHSEVVPVCQLPTSSRDISQGIFTHRHRPACVGQGAN